MSVDEADLAAAFEAERRLPLPTPSAALLARMSADAWRVAAERRAAAQRPPVRPWQVAVGLMAAALTGVTIGLAAPVPETDEAGYDLAALLPGYGETLLLAESGG